MTYRILSFEDEDAHFDVIRTAVGDLTTGAGREPVELVRFKSGFLFPSAQIHSIRDDTQPPLVFSYPGGAPTPARPEYYQTDFDAAILDQYVEKANTNWGQRFLEWLDNADFQGRVSVVSQRSRQADKLTRIASFNKEGDWAKRAAYHALNDGKPVHLPEDERDWRVNYRGRDPQHFLTGAKGFYARNRADLTLPSWRQAYFGADKQLAQDLSEFFELATQRETTVERPLEQVVSMVLSPSNSAERSQSRALQAAKVLWFDCGADDLTDDYFDKIEELVNALSGSPIPVILAEGLKMGDSNRITELAAVWVRRSTLLEPASRAHWAGDSIEELAKRYAKFENAARNSPKGVGKPSVEWDVATIDAARAAAEAIVLPLLLARNYRILCGSKKPSLAKWISQTAGAQLNSNFYPVMPKIVAGLRDARPPRVSERQHKALRLVEKPRKPTNPKPIDS